MKSVKILMVVLLTAVFLGSFGSKFVRADSKIAYIDLEEVFDEYQKTKDFDKDLEGEKKDKQSQREKMVESIRKLKDGLELLNEDAKKEKQNEVDQKIKELQDFDRQVNTELRQKYDSMVREILKEINATIEEYGQKEKFDAIFDNRVLLYSNDSMNTTDYILKILNERYKREH